MKDYLIPSNVKSRFEFFPGFGWIELGLTVGGIMVGGILYFLIGFLNQSFIVRFLPGVIITSVMFLGSVQNPRTGFSPFSFFRRQKRYQQQQNRFRYVFCSGGGLDDSKIIRKK